MARYIAGMKRRLGRIVVCVFLGVFSTIGLAWLLSYANWRPPHSWIVAPTLFVEDSHAIWQVRAKRMAGAGRANSVLIWTKEDPRETVRIIDPDGDDRGEVWILKDERPTVFLGEMPYAKGILSGWRRVPPWSAARRSEWPLISPYDGRRAVVLDYAWGWPFLAMRYTVHGVDVSDSTPTWYVTRGDLVAPKYRPWRPDRRVPLLPIPFGFALDTVVYGLLWLGIVESVLGWLARGRRAKRTRRGLCPSCGYDLRAARHERCPECGERIPAGDGQ